MRRRMLTRKGKAFIWGAAALIGFVLFEFVYGVCLLHPAQAVWEAEQKLSCGRTEQVCCVRDEAVGQRVYLTANENTVLLTGTYRTIYELEGWSRTYDVQDCSESAPFYGGALLLSDGAQESAVYLYGRVDDPEISEICASFRYTEDCGAEESDESLHVYTTSVENWYRKGTERYFLLRSETLYPVFQMQQKHYSNQGCCYDVTLTALDAQGRVAAEIEVK